MRSKILFLAFTTALSFFGYNQVQAAYDLNDYLRPAVGNTWSNLSVESSPGSSRKSSWVDLNKIVREETVGGILTWRKEGITPGSLVEYSNMAITDEQLMMVRETDEEDGQIIEYLCTVPMAVPRYLEIGQAHEASFNCGQAGSIRYQLLAHEGVSVEAGSFQDCLKVTSQIRMSNSSNYREDNVEWICRGVGTVKSQYDSQWIKDDGSTGSESNRDELRWGTFNGISYGEGEKTIGSLRTAFANAWFSDNYRMDINQLFDGDQRFSASFVLDPTRVFFSYTGNASHPVGQAFPGISFEGAYIKMNGTTLYIYDVLFGGNKFKTEWELVIFPEIGFEFRNIEAMPAP